MKKYLFTLALGSIASVGLCQTVWVNREDLWSQTEVLYVAGTNDFTKTDGTISGGQYNINANRRLFLKYVVGAATNAPNWHPDVNQIVSPSVFQDYPLVGNGTYVNGVYWGISCTTRTTSQTFEEYVGGVSTNVMAVRNGEERVNQYVWINPQ